jgi:hypothetical protein
MNKETLKKLLNERNFTYPQFLQRARNNTVSTQWGMGIGEPYSLEPYRMELLGGKPGRMLKKVSEPAKNRYLYSFDKDGRVIHKLEYCFIGGPPGNKSWVHHDDFYEYFDDHALRFVFHSISHDDEPRDLTRVVWISFDKDRVKKYFQLENNNYEYTETSYFYDDDNIIKIITSWPEGPYPDRNYRIIHEPDSFRIVEIHNSEEIPVFPSP